MPEPLAYLNGQILPLAQLAIPVADAGFVFGATATDFVRTFHGKLFRLNDHIERFLQSCELCRIPMSASAGELEAAAVRLVEENLQLTAAAPSPPFPLLRNWGEGS